MSPSIWSNASGSPTAMAKAVSSPTSLSSTGFFKDPVFTGAIIDRLAHKANVLDISREQGGRFEETIAWMTNKHYPNPTTTG